MDLFHKFSNIPGAVSATEFTAIRLSDRRKDFLAKGSDGAPVFLLQDASTAKYNPGIQFRHLSAQFHATCRVQTGTAILQDQFAVVSCDAATPDLHELFVRCFGAAIEDLPTSCGTKELKSSIQQLLDLFRELSQPNGREVSGLWTELYVIANSGHVPEVLAIWHEDQFDRFDFSCDALYLEVKSSVRTFRTHEFALEQLKPPANGNGYIVSVLLQSLTGGIGILDLATEIESAVAFQPKLKQKLWKNIANALGTDYSEKLDKRFDVFYAEHNFRIYAMSDIPSPEHPRDTRVTAVRFSADLTSVVSSLSESPMPTLRKIFASALDGTSISAISSV